MAWPLANCQVTVHEPIAVDPAVTFTDAWKPPCHWPTMVYAAAHERGPPPGGLDGGLFGGRLPAGVLGGVVGGLLTGVPEPSAVSTASYAGFLLPLLSNSSGFWPVRHESLSRMPHTVMPEQRATFMHARTVLVYPAVG